MCVCHVTVMLHLCPHVIPRGQLTVEAAQRCVLSSVMGSKFSSYSNRKMYLVELTPFYKLQFVCFVPIRDEWNVSFVPNLFFHSYVTRQNRQKRPR